jgi:hypothetical protein
VRELAITSPVTELTLARPSLERALDHVLRRPANAASARGQSLLLQDLGRLPRGFDLLAATLELASANVAGFFDPERSSLYVADDLAPADRDNTLLHEYVHALQASHFDLTGLLRPSDGEGDRSAALHGLAEGDAVLATQLSTGTPPPSSEQIERELEARSPHVPAIVRRATAAVYEDGYRFVAQLHEAGGWDAVNAAWHAPPASTEQLLHPERYRAREPWQEFPAASGPDPSCKPVYWDVLGEQGLRTLFAEWHAPADVITVTDGWNGDRAEVFVCGDASASLLRIAFDAVSRAEAAERFLVGEVEHGPHQRISVSRASGGHEIAIAASLDLDGARLEAWGHAALVAMTPAQRP